MEAHQSNIPIIRELPVPRIRIQPVSSHKLPVNLEENYRNAARGLCLIVAIEERLLSVLYSYIFRCIVVLY